MEPESLLSPKNAYDASAKQRGTSKGLVYIVEDEVDIVELIQTHLRKEGFLCRSFNNSDSFIDHLAQASESPLLLVLDLMLPGSRDGYDVLRDLRSDARHKKLPIIVLTAKSEEIDKVLGLELGADDYIVKPFSPRELVARTKSLLRRYKQTQLDEGDSLSIELGGGVSIDKKGSRVLKDGNDVELTGIEYRILLILAERKGDYLSREQILEGLYPDGRYVSERTVDVHVRRIRQKIREDVVESSRGFGYRANGQG